MKWLCLSWCVISSALLAAPCQREQDCVEQGWHVGVALGVGARSNPLVGGDRIPLVLLPEIAWYGETAYFDNGEWGAQWSNSERSALDVFLTVNRERAFFSFWHPANIFIDNRFMVSNEGQLDGEVRESLALDIGDVSKRRWALDAGIRWHIFGDDHEWQFAASSDASRVHKGHQFSWRYLQQWSIADGQLQAHIGATWKSAALIDYYYGVDRDDNVVPELYYRGQAGWQPELGLSYQAPLSSQWSWLMRASLVKLHTGMTDSPLVEENRVLTFFTGAAYQF